MFFNPIFINPQNFIGQAGAENSKKNKLSFLFSDIIKNSLGKYSSEKNSAIKTTGIETKTLGTTTLGTDLKSSLVNDTSSVIPSNINSVQSLILEIKDLIENTIKDTKSSPTVSTSSINENHKDVSMTVVDGDKLNDVLEKLISYLNNVGYKIDIQDSEFQQKINLMFGSTLQKKIDKMVSDIESLIKTGKELTFNFSIEDKTLSIQTLYSTKKPNVIQQPTLTKNLKPESLNSENKDKISLPNLKNDIISPKTISDIETIIPKDKIPVIKGFPNQNEIANVNKVMQHPSEINKSKVSLLKISLDMQTNKLADKIDSTISVGSSNKIILQIGNELLQAKIKEFEAKDAENGQIKKSESPSTKIVQNIKKIENQLLKQESFAGKIKFDEAALKEIRNQNFDLLNLGAKFQRTNNIIKVDEKPKRHNVSTTNQISITKLSSNIIDKGIEQTLSNKSSNEVELTTHDFLKILKVNKTNMVSELRKIVKENKDDNLKIQFYSESDNKEKHVEKLNSNTKPETAKDVSLKTGTQKITIKGIELKAPETNIIKDSSVLLTKNISEKTVPDLDPEKSGKLLKLDFEQFKSAIKMNSISKTLKSLVKVFDKMQDVKVELKGEQSAKTINENKTRVDEPIQIEAKRDSASKPLSKEIKNNSSQKVEEKPEVKKSFAKTVKRVINDNKYQAEEITKKTNNSIKTRDSSAPQVNQSTEKFISKKDTNPKLNQEIEIKEQVQKQNFTKSNKTVKIELNKESVSKPSLEKLSNSQSTEKNSTSIKTPLENINNEKDSGKIKLQTNPAAEIPQVKKINTFKSDSFQTKNELTVSDNNKAGNLSSNFADGSSENSNMNSNQNNTESYPGNNKDKPQISNTTEDEIINQKTSITSQIDSGESRNIKPETTNFSKHFPQMEKTIKVTELYDEISKIVNRKEKQSVMLQIIPKEIGKVKILIDIVENVLQAKIEVENDTAKMLIQNNMEQLRQSLSQSGIQLNTYSISLTGQNDKNLRSQYAKKKSGEREKINNEEEKSKPVSGKALGYNTYEYLI